MPKLSLVTMRLVLSLSLATFLSASAPAQEQIEEPPKIALCHPLGIKAGEKTKVTIRGWKLDQTTDVKCNLESATINVLNKGSAPVPGRQDAKSIGDTQVEIEITLPADATATTAELTVAAGDHISPPHEVFIGGTALIAEEESNDGFADAQSIVVPQTVEGSLHADRNVDVFQFMAQAGQKIEIEVVARERGSALDAILTLSDSERQLIETVDDAPRESNGETLDPKIGFQCRKAGLYYIVIQDALDRGGPAHPWRLIVQSND